MHAHEESETRMQHLNAHTHQVEGRKEGKCNSDSDADADLNTHNGCMEVDETKRHKPVINKGKEKKVKEMHIRERERERESE